MSEVAVATVPLAVEDFVPVLFAAIGLWLIARDIDVDRPGWGRVARLGALLVTLGGLTKAGWKLNLALTGDDVDWLEEGLFVLLAPGFALVVAALSSRPLARWWVYAVVPALALAPWTSGTSLLVHAVIGATATGVLCVLRARRRGDGLAAALFGVQIALAFALVPFATPPQTIAKQWTEQTINTVGQAAFAAAAWRLAGRARAHAPSYREAVSI